MSYRAWQPFRCLPAALLAIVGVVAGSGIVPQPARAATVTPEIQRAVRGVTFEVVIPKASEDPLSYEKPLPLELVPYVERNDKYWSIGTAFALAPGEFVTAGHVLLTVVGSQFGAPALRDSAGTIYPISRISRFSSTEDFVGRRCACAYLPPIVSWRQPS